MSDVSAILFVMLSTSAALAASGGFATLDWAAPPVAEELGLLSRFRRKSLELFDGDAAFCVLSVPAAVVAVMAGGNTLDADGCRWREATRSCASKGELLDVLPTL